MVVPMKSTPSALPAFDKALKGFIAATSKSKTYARECAELALEHFDKTGDLVYCQNFFDALTKHANNFIRKAAYTKWLQAHAPITMEKGKLKKDKRPGAMEKVKLAEAKAKPFWDFAPDTEALFFTAGDVVQALDRLLKGFESDKSKAKKAKDADATLMVHKLREVFTPFLEIAETANDDTAEAEETTTEAEKAA